MRQRFHIERRVSKLADSLTLDVIEGVLKKLANPKPRRNELLAHNSREQSWCCSCTYCRVLLIYTYLSIEEHRAERRDNRRKAEHCYYKKTHIKSIKDTLERLPMTNLLTLHLQESRKYIGQNITDLRFGAIKELQGLESILIHAEQIIAKYQIPTKPTGIINRVDWF